MGGIFALIAVLGHYFSDMEYLTLPLAGGIFALGAAVAVLLLIWNLVQLGVKTKKTSSGSQKSAGNAAEYPNFLQPRHNAHKAKQERQCPKINVGGVLSIRRYRKSGQQSQQHCGTQHRLLFETAFWPRLPPTHFPQGNAPIADIALPVL